MRTTGAITVGVEGWSRTRRVEDRGQTVAMEIARTACRHCPTCANRMDTVAARVHRAGFPVQWEAVGGGQFIVIPLPPQKDPVTHLREMLGLDIWPIERGD